jgi:hypothetical protein
MKKFRVLLPLALLTLAPGVAPLRAQLAPATTPDAPAPRPAAVINLATPEGVALVKGQWRYSDVKIIEVDHRSPGADLRPSGPPNRTLDITPKAGAADFDDSSWQMIEPAGIETRRAGGRFCFNWYRIKVTLPEKVAAFDVTGSTVVFELVVDDYSEVWVNSKLPVVLGQTGGGLVKGFNAPNRVVLTRDARPGQQFHLAIFGANGPMSNPPGNYIWIRSATLDFFPRGTAGNVQRVDVKVDRRDAGLDEILPTEPVFERVATGFYFTEGPVWVKATPTTEGLPAVQRSKREHDLPVVAGRPNFRVHGQERVHRLRHRRIRPSGFERTHAQQGRPADDQPARQPPGGAPGAHGRHYGARGPLSGQAAEQPQRSGVQVRRRALLHRPAVWLAKILRRSAQRAAVQRRVRGPRRRRAHARHG